VKATARREIDPPGDPDAWIPAPVLPEPVVRGVIVTTAARAALERFELRVGAPGAVTSDPEKGVHSLASRFFGSSCGQNGQTPG
jgi:hypothetical protein